MNDMQEKIDELDAETAKELLRVLSNQVQQSLEQITQLDARLTSANLLTNGGAAVAMLAFLGTREANIPMIVAIGLFAAGVIFAMLQMSALLRFFGALSTDAMRRRGGFVNGELSVQECLVPPGIAGFDRRANSLAGVASQLSFALGVIVGAVGLIVG